MVIINMVIDDTTIDPRIQAFADRFQQQLNQMLKEWKSFTDVWNIKAKAGRKPKLILDENNEEVPIEHLIDLYTKDNMSLEQLGKKYNVNRNTIRDRLLSAGVDINLPDGFEIHPCMSCGKPVRTGFIGCLTGVYCNTCQPPNLDYSCEPNRHQALPSEFSTPCPKCDGVMRCYDKWFYAKNTFVCQKCGFAEKY